MSLLSLVYYQCDSECEALFHSDKASHINAALALLCLSPLKISFSMPSRSTVVVRNLPRLTTAVDVQRFFDTRIRDAEAIVFPLLKDTQNAAGNFQCTTVSLKHTWKKKALALNEQEFIPAAGGGTSKIQIDASFIGSITLAEHNNPQFE